MQTKAIINLQRIDAEELREALPPGTVTIQSDFGSTSMAHDILTVLAVIVISREVLRVLAAYIVRRLERDETHLSIEIEKADGTRRNIEFSRERCDVSSESEVLDALQHAFQLEADPHLSTFLKSNPN